MTLKEQLPAAHLIPVDGHEIVGGHSNEGHVGGLRLQDGVVDGLSLLLATLQTQKMSKKLNLLLRTCRSKFVRCQRTPHSGKIKKHL